MSNSKKMGINCEILFEDNDYVVINKPAGIMVHSDGKSNGPFITDWFTSNYPKSKGVGEPARDMAGKDIDRSGIVHRLDRDTTGAMILAKTQAGFDFLKKQFEDKKIVKKYISFVWGEIKIDFGTIDRPIGRSSSDFRKWSAKRGARGEMRPAETYWTRLWTGKCKTEEKNEEKISLVCAEPKTGRTHQIRVHMEYINHPVIGDTLYSPKRPFILGFKRVALHSWFVRFSDINGKKVEVVAPFTTDFKEAFDILNIDFDKMSKIVSNT
jgi:23S rRNA pseudouridine1911/1915/1917 synthase